MTKLNGIRLRADEELDAGNTALLRECIGMLAGDAGSVKYIDLDGEELTAPKQPLSAMERKFAQRLVFNFSSANDDLLMGERVGILGVELNDVLGKTTEDMKPKGLSILIGLMTPDKGSKSAEIPEKIGGLVHGLAYAINAGTITRDRIPALNQQAIEM